MYFSNLPNLYQLNNINDNNFKSIVDKMIEYLKIYIQIKKELEYFDLIPKTNINEIKRAKTMFDPKIITFLNSVPSESVTTRASSTASSTASSSAISSVAKDLELPLPISRMSRMSRTASFKDLSQASVIQESSKTLNSISSQTINFLNMPTDELIGYDTISTGESESNKIYIKEKLYIYNQYLDKYIGKNINNLTNIDKLEISNIIKELNINKKNLGENAKKILIAKFNGLINPEPSLELLDGGKRKYK